VTSENTAGFSLTPEHRHQSQNSRSCPARDAKKKSRPLPYNHKYSRASVVSVWPLSRPERRIGIHRHFMRAKGSRKTHLLIPSAESFHRSNPPLVKTAIEHPTADQLPRRHIKSRIINRTPFGRTPPRTSLNSALLSEYQPLSALEIDRSIRGHDVKMGSRDGVH